MSWKFWQPPLRREVEDEIAFHLEMRARDLTRQGVPADAARLEARHRLGDIPAMRRHLMTLGRERNRTMHRTEWLAELRQDLAYGFRTLARNPGFTVVALLTLGIGIGGTTAIFSAVNAVVLRPLPIPDVQRVMLVSEYSGGRIGNVSVGNLVDWQAANAKQPVFSELGAIDWVNLTLPGDQPERLLGAQVTADYFRTFRVAPLTGRVFTAEEDVPGGPKVVVLSHRFWQRRYAGDPAVVGQTIQLNGQAHSVLGIMPSSFDFSVGTEELWIPSAFTPEQRAQHDEHYLTVYGRLSDGVSMAAAESMLKEVQRVLSERHPNANGNNTVQLQPMMQQYVGDARGQLLLILGAVGLVLLIACANVANLLLARGAARARELAIRASIGAGKGRIVRQLLAESAALALAASVLGVGVAWMVIRTLVAAAPPGVPRLEQAGLDLPTLGFAMVLTLTSTLLFGLAPALRTAATNLQGVLRTGQARSAAGKRDWLRQGLVSAEVALALMLLVGATLLVRTAAHLQRVDPGFVPEGVLTGRLALPAEKYGSPEQVQQAFARVLDELATSPGVRRAALSNQVPMGPGGGDNGLIPEGKPLEHSSSVGSRLRIVSPGYLATMGIPLHQGWDFGPEDRTGATRVMLVNQTLARRLFPGEDPLGKRVACCEGAPDDPRWKTIIGVVGDVRSQGPAGEIQPEFFLPIAQAPDVAWNWIGRAMSLVVRSEGDPAALAPVLREAVRRMDPSLPIFRVGTMESTLATSMAPARFRTALLGSLALTGLLLALVGIYGVISYLVTRRRAEIGVRMALGASTGNVLRLVVGQGLRPVLVGVAAGTVGAFAATRLMASWLRGISPTDPMTFGAVAIVLVAVATGASLIPARRAAKVSALEAIRSE